VCTFEYQIAEIRRKLNTTFQDVVTKQERAELISLIRRACTLLEPQSRRNLSPDPDDSPLIDLAIEAGAEYLVSGDPDVLKVSHKNLKIRTPASFLKQVKK
jgi:putative PIN family toxin of toxin-antitoxin system